MNPILQDIYSTIIPSAPFIIAAYALFWVVSVSYTHLTLPTKRIV